MHTNHYSIIDLNSQWIGENLIRTRVRYFGKRNTMMIDVTEIAPRHTSKERALRLACQAARRVGCASVDCIHVSDHEIIRSSRNIHTNEPVRTKIRTTTFAFDGLD